MTKSIAGILLLAGMTLLASWLSPTFGGAPMQKDTQGAGQDMKDAGRSTERAAKKTGRKTKKETKKGAHKAASSVKKGASKVEKKTD